MKALFKFAESQKNIDAVARAGGVVLGVFGVLLSLALLLSIHAR